MFIFALSALHSQVVYFSGKDKTTSGIEGLDTPQILTFGIDLISMNSKGDKLIFKIKTENNISLSIRLFSLNGELISNHLFFVPQGNKDIEIYEPLINGTYLAVFSDGIRSKSIMISKSDEISIGKTNEFILEKPVNFEFKNWSIYLSSIKFWSNYRQYIYSGDPRSQKRDSSISKDYFDTGELNYNNKYFDSDSCYYLDSNELKYNYQYCCFLLNESDCKDFEFCDISLNLHFNIDTINNIIKELIVEYYFEGTTYTTYGSENLYDSFKFIFQNIPFSFTNEGSIIAEVKANDYKNVLKEYHNYYDFTDWTSSCCPIFTYIDWLELNKINNDTFFRLVLSK